MPLDGACSLLKVFICTKLPASHSKSNDDRILSGIFKKYESNCIKFVIVFKLNCLYCEIKILERLGKFNLFISLWAQSRIAFSIRGGGPLCLTDDACGVVSVS